MIMSKEKGTRAQTPKKATERKRAIKRMGESTNVKDRLSMICRRRHLHNCHHLFDHISIYFLLSFPGSVPLRY